MTSPRSAVHELVSELDYPMFIVTVAAGGERAGCLVGFATQCSIDPPRYLVCLSKANNTSTAAAGAEVLVVHVLGDDQLDLARLFGELTGDDVDKFSACSWRPGPARAPILLDCPAWFAGRVLDRFDLGDHTGFLLDPVEVSTTPDMRPLLFSAVKDLDAGHPA